MTVVLVAVLMLFPNPLGCFFIKKEASAKSDDSYKKDLMIPIRIYKKDYLKHQSFSLFQKYYSVLNKKSSHCVKLSTSKEIGNLSKFLSASCYFLFFLQSEVLYPVGTKSNVSGLDAEKLWPSRDYVVSNLMLCS